MHDSNQGPDEAGAEERHAAAGGLRGGRGSRGHHPDPGKGTGVCKGRNFVGWVLYFRIQPRLGWACSPPLAPSLKLCLSRVYGRCHSFLNSSTSIVTNFLQQLLNVCCMSCACASPPTDAAVSGVALASSRRAVLRWRLRCGGRWGLITTLGCWGSGGHTKQHQRHNNYDTAVEHSPGELCTSRIWTTTS